MQLYLEAITIKRECVSKMFCVWSVIISFYVDSCVNRNFLVSDKVFCKVTKCTRTSSSLLKETNCLSVGSLVKQTFCNESVLRAVKMSGLDQEFGRVEVKKFQ